MPADLPRETRTQAPGSINEVFHLYDPPLWLLTARHGEQLGGLIATAATRASIVPEIPRMLVAIATHHYTRGLIEATGTFALHLLAAHDLASVRRFGLATGHRVDKFSDLPTGRTPAGLPLIESAMSWLDCRVEARMDIGDRTAYLAEVTAGAVLSRGPLLTVAGLLRDLPEADRSELRRLYAQDQDTDRTAILAWRRSRPDT